MNVSTTCVYIFCIIAFIVLFCILIKLLTDLTGDKSAGGALKALGCLVLVGIIVCCPSLGKTLGGGIAGMAKKSPRPHYRKGTHVNGKTPHYRIGTWVNEKNK